ncbi:hypothetical protein V1477_014823 [Vespula maculifrons]|uniref:Endonuclease/exonuclease/phosphatase domain-containing protein n=1 Tax=Vespula maculifrons TaxID=7453 RepID=A0ABD2BIJ1_VESMC
MAYSNKARSMSAEMILKPYIRITLSHGKNNSNTISVAKKFLGSFQNDIHEMSSSICRSNELPNEHSGYTETGLQVKRRGNWSGFIVGDLNAKSPTFISWPKHTTNSAFSRGGVFSNNETIINLCVR